MTPARKTLVETGSADVAPKTPCGTSGLGVQMWVVWWEGEQRWLR